MHCTDASRAGPTISGLRERVEPGLEATAGRAEAGFVAPPIRPEPRGIRLFVKRTKAFSHLTRKVLLPIHFFCPMPSHFEQFGLCRFGRMSLGASELAKSSFTPD